jgi:hypothetical protein
MSTPTHKLFIPLTRRPPRETLLLAHPWFLRPSNEVPVTATPRLLQFTNDDFVNGLFSGVESSGGEWDKNAFERLLAYRDYAEPPATMLDEHGDPLYPASVVRDDDPANALDDSQETPPANWLRKLYLPLHCHFHVVTLELHCRRAGFPRVSPDRVLETGIVIRRLVADRERQRWEDWLPVDADKGLWLEIADTDMRPLGQGARVPVLDPRAIATRLPAVAETELRARARLAEDAPLPDSLLVKRLSPLPTTIGKAANHSAWFSYLPLNNGAFQLPPFADPADLNATQIAALLRKRAADRLRAEWLNKRPPSPGDVAAFVAQLKASIQTPLRDLVELLMLPAPPTSNPVEARSRLESGWDETTASGTTFHHNPATTNAETAIRATIQRSLWLEANSIDVASGWTDTLEERVVTEARARRPANAGWDDTNHALFEPDVRTLFAFYLHEIIDHCAPGSGLPATGANTDIDVQHLLSVLLMRVRACRMALQDRINQAVFAGDAPDLNRVFPESGSDGADDYPVVTAGSLSDEIEAWLDADSAEARVEVPRPWSPLNSDPFLVSVQNAARRLELACGEINERGAAAGNAYLEETARRRQNTNDDLRARVRDTLLAPPNQPKSDGDELRIIGLDLVAQPEMGLLVFPGPAPTVATVEDMIGGVAGRYTASGSPVPSVDSQRSEAAQLLNLVRPRLDSDSLYAVWCFVRVAGRDPCEAEQLVWTPGSEVFSLAEPTDILGVKPVAMQLPDLKKLVRDIPRIPKARANPFAAVNIPADSGINSGEEIADTSRQWGVQMICSYGIPVFTICAWALFSVILHILLIIPGFGWMRLLKFCLPAPAKK